MLGLLLFFVIVSQFLAAFISSASDLSGWSQFGMHAIAFLLACCASYLVHMSEKNWIESDEDY